MRSPGTGGEVAILLTALVFTALKTVPALAHAASAVFGTIVCDPTDLIALPSLVLSYRYMTRHVPMWTAPRWARMGAIALAGLASMATSAPQIQHGYAEWEVISEEFRQIGCAEATAWVSKSGKQGLGVTVRFTSPDPTCVVQVKDAVVTRADKARVMTSMTLPANVSAGQANGNPRPDPSRQNNPEYPRPPEPPPDAGAFLYVPFPFDNEDGWNGNQRQATLSLHMVSQGKDVSWDIPLYLRYDGYHVPIERAPADVHDLTRPTSNPPPTSSVSPLPRRYGPVQDQRPYAVPPPESSPNGAQP